MKKYHDNDLTLITNSFVFDNLDEKDLAADQRFWYKVTEDEVVYSFRSHKDTNCIVLNSSGLSEQKSTTFTGKLPVPLLDADTLDFAKAIDEMLCSLCILKFKESIRNFGSVLRSEVQEWVSNCEDGGSFYANQKTQESFTAENVFTVSLPDDVIMFLPPTDCAGIISYRLDESENLTKFGISMFLNPVMFVNLVDRVL